MMHFHLHQIKSSGVQGWQHFFSSTVLKETPQPQCWWIGCMYVYRMDEMYICFSSLNIMRIIEAQTCHPPLTYT